MKSLSLRGTHTEKIRSFGEAFKRFTGLRLLDLSRNSIVSLEGIQYLISLEKLNLYYNNVPSLKEVSCLQLLSDLKELDLRLNPVTSSKEDYRLSVVSMLPKLEKLEYRPLPSPTRSSLRSPGKSPTRSKDGFRVTFSDSRAPADPARSSHVAEMDKALSSPGLSGIESTYLCKQHRSVNHAYQTPTPLRDETPANSYSDASSIVPRGSCTRLHAEKHAYKSSYLYLTTHINNEKATSASSGSSSKKSTVSIELTPQGCMTTPDRSHPAPSVSSRPRVSRGLMEQLNSELLSKKKPSTPAQEKKRFPRPAEFSNSFSPRTELRRAGSLNSVLYTVSDYKRREREATDLTGYRSQSPPSSSSQSISDISSVLKQLLDLVDRYWNGSKSLHLNRRFLRIPEEKSVAAFGGEQRFANTGTKDRYKDCCLSNYWLAGFQESVLWKDAFSLSRFQDSRLFIDRDGCTFRHLHYYINTAKLASSCATEVNLLSEQASVLNLTSLLQALENLQTGKHYLRARPADVHVSERASFELLENTNMQYQVTRADQKSGINRIFGDERRSLDC
ncbi:Centrosomal protein of 72 kDa [Acipenser ruthenus]|uniref:Centrosomal protein of 72 kDa n=1 Tax=Acipenser ruthenus TaxID=7906 RepID=A0A444UEL6_ACIRT|nr:Centrosomal protein of 72 kDa [Acipenser ruthenus]